jgi:hypothetical protein
MRVGEQDANGKGSVNTAASGYEYDREENEKRRERSAEVQNTQIRKDS